MRDTGILAGDVELHKQRESMNIPTELANFLDNNSRLKSYPAKRRLKILSLFYLASKFKGGRKYSEKEVNQILKSWHTFGDWAMLRRDLYDNFFLGREPDCSAYWLEEKQPAMEPFEI